MRILFVIHSLGGGGAERILVEVANSLADRHDVTVMTVVDSGINRERLNDSVCYRSFVHLPFKRKAVDVSKESSGSLLAGGSTLRKMIASIYELLWRIAPAGILYRIAVKETYDAEVSFLEGICAKLVAASSNASSRKTCWIHVDVSKEPKSHRVFLGVENERRTYEKFDSIVAVSNDVKDSFESYLGLPSGSVEVCRNPIDVHAIRELSLLSLEQRDRDLFNGFVFCSIGRLCEQKAFDRLIKAVSLLRREGHACSALVLGEGKLEKDLRLLVEAEHVEDCVHLLGFRSNPYPILARSNCYICTSIAEGMSTTVSEAIILGIPVITTKCAGASDLVGISQGRIVGDDVESIAQAMLDEMRSGSKKRVVPRHRIDDFFDKTKALQKVEELICG